MKKIYTLLLFLCFHSYFCFSQDSGEDANNSKVEAVKVGYMSRELNLTETEAQNFWPVYNNYANEIRQARIQYPDDEVAFEKKVVQIKERYQGNFKKVLGNNNQRVNKVYTTDKQFNNALRNELRSRQQRQMQNNQPQQKNQVQRQNHPQSNAGNKNIPQRPNKKKPNQRH